MDTNAIRAFHRIAELGNLTRAAEALNLSQPTLSRIIGSLEAEVGVALFVRKRSGMVLTESGSKFRHSSDAVIRQIDLAVGEARLGDQSPSGHIKLGLPRSLSEILIVPLMLHLSSSFPAATFSLVTGATDEIEQAISDGAVDIAILASPQTRVRVADVRPIASEAIMLITKNDRDLPSGKMITGSALQGLPLILLSRRNFLRRKIEELARGAGFEPRVTTEVSDPLLIVDLVAKGAGYSALPASTCLNALNKRLIAGRALSQARVVWTLARSGRTISHRIETAVELEIVRIFQAHAKQGLWKLVG